MHDNKPYHTIYARGVKATVWENVNGDGKPFFTTNIVRIYHDGTEWKETTAYLDHQLPLVRLVAEEAYRFIQLGGRKAGRGQAANDNEAAKESDSAPLANENAHGEASQNHEGEGREEESQRGGSSASPEGKEGFAERVGSSSGRSSRSR